MSDYGEPKFEQLVDQKLEQILKSKRETTNCARRAARGIVLDRSRKRFFEDVYERNYAPKDLKRRPFLNIGPGSFRHKHWRLADKTYDSKGRTWTEMRRGVSQAGFDHEWDLYERKPIDLPDNSMKAVYSSHVIEHLFPEDVTFMLSEAERILERGGVLRLVCPDASLMVEAYDREDWEFFFYYLSVMTNRAQKHLGQMTEEELQRICAVFLLDWVSLVIHPNLPDRFSPNKCRQFIAAHKTTYDALDAACALSPRELNKAVGGHVNWFHFEKVKTLLEEAGFKTIRRSGYLQSRLPILRDSAYFDRTDCEMSLYVEAEKA
ncbi:MAG: methyltransferase domain-containing protein [Silicimonas sp.]|nr:methyltransferase domain-containing protein [Silicimonas sp.]